MAFTRNDYTIGWIATLDVELAAAKAMLERPYHPKLPKAAKDTNTYTLGRLGEHNVVIAGLPSGAVGTSSAAIAASNLVRSFPKVRFVMMVGLAEGVSITSLPPEKDVRLGDIVVSSPNGFHGWFCSASVQSNERQEVLYNLTMERPLRLASRVREC